MYRGSRIRQSCSSILLMHSGQTNETTSSRWCCMGAAEDQTTYQRRDNALMGFAWCRQYSVCSFLETERLAANPFTSLWRQMMLVQNTCDLLNLRYTDHALLLQGNPFHDAQTRCTITGECTKAVCIYRRHNLSLKFEVCSFSSEVRVLVSDSIDREVIAYCEWSWVRTPQAAFWRGDK